MKYKIILLIIITFITTGCFNQQEKLECEIGDTNITLTIKDGNIIKYVDKIEGELPQEKIDVLNESYLKSVNNNSEAITKLKEVIATNGGFCK